MLFYLLDKRKEVEVMLANTGAVEDLILIINRWLKVEYSSDCNIDEKSEFLREINLFTYIKRFETGVFKNGKYEIVINDSMLGWGLYYIVKIRYLK